MYPKQAISGVVLAGGRATRMGGEDKGLVKVAGRPMVEYVAECLRGQSAEILVTANRNLQRYGELCDCPVVEDIVGDFAGPLAGMASAMRFARTPYILTAPCDSPLVSAALGRRLFEALEKERAEIAVAHDGERMQPVCALLHRDLLESMLAYLESGESKIDRWYAKHRTALGDFSDEPSMFLNINTPAQLAELEARLLKACAS